MALAFFSPTIHRRADFFNNLKIERLLATPQGHAASENVPAGFCNYYRLQVPIRSSC